MWKVPFELEGKTTFIVAGGPSFRSHHAELLRGNFVIAINSAWLSIPWADVIMFCDQRWWSGEAVGKPWQEAGKFTTQEFKGRIVTTSAYVRDDRVLRLMRQRPPTWSRNPQFLTSNHSTTTAAINYLSLAGSKRIVICGLDGKVAENGKRHHHGADYPWRLKPESYSWHANEYASVAPAIRRMGVEVLNANPDSAHTVWPRVSLEEVMELV